MCRKILVISNNSFSNITNNGKTLESIFRGESKSNLSQLYFTDYCEPDFDFCNQYFRILDIEVLKSIYNTQKKAGGNIDKSTFLNHSESINKNLKSIFRINTNSSFFRWLRDLLWTTNSWKTNSLNNWALEQKPDYVFFVGGAAKFPHTIAIYLSKMLNCPLVSFFTDDYLIYPKRRNLFDFIQQIRLKEFYTNTIQHSSLCFAIGDLMCDAYTKYFGKDFHPIMNSIQLKNYQESLTQNQNVVISYFGSIHTNRWKMIVKLGLILKTFYDNEIVLNIFTPNYLEQKVLKTFIKSNVCYKGLVIGDEMQEAMLKSDILLHIESDDNFSKSLTYLSISTKIPEYLISGRPILGFGPKDVASMKLLIDNNIGIVISPTEEPEIIHEELKKIIIDREFRKTLGKNGYEFAVNNFDNEKIREKFKLKIENIFLSLLISIFLI